MKKILAVATAFVLLCLLALPAAALEPQDYAAEVLRLVNVERARQNLSPLSGANSELTKAAQKRAGEIDRRFSHTRPNGKQWYTVYDEFNVGNWSRRGENIAEGYATPAAVIAAWMNSPGHRANILGQYTHMGVGVRQNGNGRLAWVQLFLAEPPTSSANAAAPVQRNFWDNWPMFFQNVLRYVFFGWLWMRWVSL